MLRSPDGVQRAWAEAVAAATSSSSSGGGQNLLDLDVQQEQDDEREKQTVKALTGEVEERLGRLHRLRKERSEAIKDLKHLAQTDDVSQLLLLQRRAGPTGADEGYSALFAQALEKFRPFQTRLASAIEHEGATLEELSKLLEQLQGVKGAKRIAEDFHKAEKAVAGLKARIGGEIADYREVRRALKYVRTSPLSQEDASGLNMQFILGVDWSSITSYRV